MRVVREYSGVDRTHREYEQEVTGVGGNPASFFVLCEAGRENGKARRPHDSAFTHDEMAHLPVDYRSTIQ